jgi:hypothetical protein
MSLPKATLGVLTFCICIIIKSCISCKTFLKDITLILFLCFIFYSVSSACFNDIPNWNISAQLSYGSYVQLASRALQHQVTPLITMNLTLENKTALASGSSTRKNIVLQTDPTNLVHITQVLEEALHESRSQHSRRIQRSFK